MRYPGIHSDRHDAAEGAVPRRSVVVGAAARARGLSDPNRLALALSLSAAGEASVLALADLTGIERSVVSRHLRRLRLAGLSETTRRNKLSLHWLTVEGEELLDLLLPDRTQGPGGTGREARERAIWVRRETAKNFHDPYG